MSPAEPAASTHSEAQVESAVLFAQTDSQSLTGEAGFPAGSAADPAREAPSSVSETHTHPGPAPAGLDQNQDDVITEESAA